MKKLLTVLVVLLVLGCVALAEDDLAIQVIGGPGMDLIPMSLDDVQLDKTYNIDGYAKLTPKEFLFIDYFGQFSDNADYKKTNSDYKEYHQVYYQKAALEGKSSYYYSNASWKDSGVNADFIWLRFDLINLQKKDVKFMENASVKVVYDDSYEYSGWMRQINYDYTKQVYRYGYTTTGGTYCVMSPVNEEAIGMMYTGTYVVGCTLPNAIVEDTKSPLKIIFTLDGNEITYNIRK